MELTTYIFILAVIAVLIAITAIHIVRLKRDLDKKLKRLRSLVDVWLSNKEEDFALKAEKYEEQISTLTEVPTLEPEPEPEPEPTPEPEPEPEPEPTPKEGLKTKKAAEPSETSKMLFAKLVRLMEYDRIYTNEDLNREMLAQKLCTNYKYVVKAIKECDNGNSLTNFINTYRLRHATRLLSETDDSIMIVAEASGFSHRTLTRLFQEQFGMTPTEYRKKNA